MKPKRVRSLSRLFRHAITDIDIYQPDACSCFIVIAVEMAREVQPAPLAMHMHLAAKQYPPTAYERRIHEGERMGTVFDVAMCDMGEHDKYADEPFLEELAGLDMFGCCIARPHG